MGTVGSWITEVSQEIFCAFFFFFSSRRRHTRFDCDWSSDVCSSDLEVPLSLYLIAPSPKALERLHPLYRVVLDVAMAKLMDYPVRTWRHRLLVCGDEIGRASCREKSVDLGGRRIIKKKKRKGKHRLD